MADSILQRIAGGDRTAVSECMDRYGNLVWSLARRFTNDRAEAEDSVQEVFIDLWSNAARFDPEVASETTFVSMIARRRLIDKLRKRSREPSQEELDPSIAIEPIGQNEVEIQDEAAKARVVMASLRPEQQRVLELSIYEGYTHREISDMIGLPLGTVKTHVRRGLIQIREKLRDSGAEPTGRVSG